MMLSKQCLRLLMLIMLCFPQISFSATVKAFSKKNGVVKIDSGANGGFNKGTKVCILDSEGQKFACSVIYKAIPDAAYFKIQNKKQLDAIKKDLEVVIDDGKTPPSPVKSTAHHRNIKAGYLYSIKTPATYNKLGYKQPKPDASNIDTLWEKKGAADSSPIGFLLESEFPLGRLTLATGLRYRYYRPLSTDDDYVDSEAKLEKAKYVTIKQSATALGLYADSYFFEIPMGQTLFARFAGGVDIDMSTITVDVEQKNDDPAAATNGKIYNLTTKATVVSLRLGSQLNMFLKPVGLTFGINFLVPVSETPSSSGSVSDPNVSRLTGGKSGEQDIKETVDHQKSSFGAEMIFAGYYAF